MTPPSLAWGVLFAVALSACPGPVVLQDAGLPDAGTPTDAGSVTDAGIEDAGTIDAGTPIVIDFAETSAQFPPTVNKVGFNSFWDSTSNDSNYDAWTIERSAKYRAPMISGLIEPKRLMNLPGFGPNVVTDAYEEVDGDKTAAELDAESCSLWQPGYTSGLFVDDGGVVEARRPTDPDLAALREFARSEGLITFLQISGTPGRPSATPSTVRFNGLFNLAGAPTTGGNWYPLPITSELPKLAHAFGSLPDALGYAAPTIYSFWQEPSHTIDESLTAAAAIDLYSDFYSQLATEMTTRCRWQRCPLAAAQLNANDGDGPLDGQRYKWFVDDLLARRAANPMLAMPLDYFTVQNYAAQWNDTIMPNTRIALGTTFNWTPVLMNEWDYCVNTRALDGCDGTVRSFTDRFDTAAAIQSLRWLVDSIERPDVSHVLLREKVLKDRDHTTLAVSYPWAQVPILFLASMGEFRRPASTGLAQVPMIASGDADQLRVLSWNQGSATRTFPLALRNLAPTLVGQTLQVKKFSAAIRDLNCPAPTDVMNATHDITCWVDAIAPVAITASNLTTAPITIAPTEVVMVLAGSPPAYGSRLFTDWYIRSAPFVKRDGTAASPRGTSHFDPRTGSVTLGTKNLGLAAHRLTLKNLPDLLPFTMRAAANGPLTATTIVAGIRVDYLDAAKLPVKTVFFRDSRWTATAPSWTTYEWPPLPGITEVVTNFCGTGCTQGAGTPVTLDLLANAPAGWAATRDAVLGVVLSGAVDDTTYRIDFP